MAKKHRLIAFFDSYERYLIDHDDWLKELIGSVEYGLFLVASREKLEWSDNKEELYPYKLEELPTTQAELILKSNLSPIHYKLIETIINKTQCVPLFIELAINIYKRIITQQERKIERDKKNELIKNILKTKLV